MLDFYTARYPQLSREAWLDRILSGAIRVNDRTTGPQARLAQGDRLAYHREPWVEPDVPQDFRVPYDDGEVLVADKPAGLPVTPDAWHLDHTLLALVRHRHGGSISPIHRLDRGTSGLVIFGRSRQARRALSHDLAAGRIERRYRALVRGVDLADELTIEIPIGRVPYAPTRTLHVVSPHGRPCRTEVRVLHRDRAGNRSIVELRLVTGRSHQIRIHLAAIGHPLVGDPLYARGESSSASTLGVSRPGDRPPLPGDGGYYLHAALCGFRHPCRGLAIEVVSRPPHLLRGPGE